MFWHMLGFVNRPQIVLLMVQRFPQNFPCMTDHFPEGNGYHPVK